MLQNDRALDDVRRELARTRSATRGEPRRIFEILPKCPDEVREPLATSLLNRPEPPVAEARAALDSPDPSRPRVAARILGRAGAGRPRRRRRWRPRWHGGEGLGGERRTARARRPRTRMERASDAGRRRRSTWPMGRRRTPATPAADRPGGAGLRRLWAAGDWAAERHPWRQPIRRRRPCPVPAGSARGGAPERRRAAPGGGAALGGDPEVRAIGRPGPRRRRARTGRGPLAERLLSDRVSFHRLTLARRGRPGGHPRATARRRCTYQGVVART